MFETIIADSIDLFVNRQSTFRLFAENKIGFSLGKDFGSEDYISTNGGFFWSPSIGIKKSSGKKHISLKKMFYSYLKKISSMIRNLYIILKKNLHY